MSRSRYRVSQMGIDCVLPRTYNEETRVAGASKRIRKHSRRARNFISGNSKFCEIRQCCTGRTILLVDNGSDARLTTKWFLGCVGYVVHAFSSAEEALALFDPEIHDLVITDHYMNRMTGAELAHIVKLRSPATPVLMYTKAPPPDRSCVDLLVERPVSLPVLKDAIDRLLAGGP